MFEPTQPRIIDHDPVAWELWWRTGCGHRWSRCFGLDVWDPKIFSQMVHQCVGFTKLGSFLSLHRIGIWWFWWFLTFEAIQGLAFAIRDLLDCCHDPMALMTSRYYQQYQHISNNSHQPSPRHLTSPRSRGRSPRSSRTSCRPIETIKAREDGVGWSWTVDIMTTNIFVWPYTIRYHTITVHIVHCGYHIYDGIVVFDEIMTERHPAVIIWRRSCGVSLHNSQLHEIQYITMGSVVI